MLGTQQVAKCTCPLSRMLAHLLQNFGHPLINWMAQTNKYAIYQLSLRFTIFQTLASD